MIIKSVLLDKKRYELVSEDYCNKTNAFTIIVGSNGTGKSRLLKRVVNNIRNLKNGRSLIPKNYSRHLDIDYNGYNLSFFSSSTESISIIGERKEKPVKIPYEPKVIAVTTTPFDKFPVEYKGNELYRYKNDNKYTYIGLKVSKNSLNQSNYLNLLSRSMLSNNKIFKQKKLFSMLNLNNLTYLKFKSKISLADLYFHYESYSLIKTEHSFDSFSFEIEKQTPTIFNALNKDKKLLKKAYNSYIKCAPYLSKEINPEDITLPKNDLIFLLDIKLINVEDIIFTKNTTEKIKISDLSSGQKCMILTLLNIAGSISDNCIICIDEPEISLHPKWQKEFMKVMIEFFSDFKKCHFIVATHSPLIISELSKENCFVLNMDSTTAKKALDYKNMSSDYQLVEVFGIPGNNNEYLNRLVVSLLSKLSKTGTLNEDDKIKLDELVKLSNDMDSYDTVKELINILNIAWCKVSDK